MMCDIFGAQTLVPLFACKPWWRKLAWHKAQEFFSSQRNRSCTGM